MEPILGFGRRSFIILSTGQTASGCGDRWTNRQDKPTATPTVGSRGVDQYKPERWKLSLHEVVNPEAPVSCRVEPESKKLESKQNNKILLYGKYHPFADMYLAPFMVKGQQYICANQYIAHQKTLVFNDKEAATKILNSKDPSEMKLIPVKGFDRVVWEKNERQIMIDAAVHKFSQNAELKSRLLNTGDSHLGMKSRNLRYGIGLSMISDYESKRNQWRGENRHGKYLMEARDRLRELNKMTLKEKNNAMPSHKAEALDRNQWTGENILGKALMAARHKLRMTQKSSEAKTTAGRLPVWKYRFHKQNSKTFIFDGRRSPFSTMYPAPFTVDGQTYKSATQYIAHCGALMFGDKTTAEKILVSTDPDECIRFLFSVKGFDKAKWERCEEEICVDAAVYKFSQNDKLKHLLLSTGNLHLGCMGRNLRYETGVTISPKGALFLDQTKPPGQNLDQ